MIDTTKLRKNFSIILFLVFMLIFAQFIHMSLTEPDIAFSFIFKFGMLSAFCAVGAFLNMLVSHVGWDSIFMNFANPETEHMPTQKIPYIILLPIVFGVILAGGAFAGIQVLPTSEFIPATISGEPLQLTDTELTLFSSVYPALLEDFSTLMIIGIIASILLWLTSLVVEVSSLTYIPTRIIAIAIGSWGIGWLVPGFASAHSIVQAGNQQFFVSAFMFQFFNQLVIMVSGLFIPLAHFVHNLIWALGLNTGLLLGFIVLAGFAVHKKYIIPKIEQVFA